MEREELPPITRREIDALDRNALLSLARRHAKLLGKQYPKRMEEFYCPRILDEPRLLQRLCGFGVEAFTELVLEQSRRDYIAGGQWAAVLLSQGGTLPDEVLTKQEAVMPDSLTKVEENDRFRSGVMEYDRPLDSALFLEVSQKARDLWASQLARYHTQSVRCRQLAQALDLREQWLGVSQTDSAEVLYALGWTPLDVMLSYLTSCVFSYCTPVDPDCAAAAARRDPEAAVRLLDPDGCQAQFPNEFHPSYFEEMAKLWTEFFYLFCGWEDTSPLERGHRRKKMSAHYRQILERRNTPDWERLVLAEELRRTGLLPSKAPPDWDSPKLPKRQRLALTHALTGHYQWRLSDLLAALASAGRREVLTALVWGVYEADHLTAAFLLDGQGAAWGEDGEQLELPPEARVGLVVPAELSREQLALWKKRLKASGGKPLIRQLTLPAQPPDFADFQGAVTKHITLYSAAGKWGLDKGDLSTHRRADLRDPLHGFGARITFDTVCDGPEYSGDEVTLLDVSFYRLDRAPFGDYLPRRALLPPEALPARFVSLAGAAFRQLAGVK